MIFKKMTLGPLDTNSYIIGSEKTKEIALIDPGFEPRRIIDEVEKIKPESIKVLLTHGHFDHSICLDKIKEHFPDLTLMYHKEEYNPQQKKPTKADVNRIISLMTNHDQANNKKEFKNNENDVELLNEFGLFTDIKANIWIIDGSKIKVGDITLITLETPGHSPGSLCFYSKDIKELRGYFMDGIIFTGDLLLKGNVGEFNVPRGDKHLLFSSIKNKIMYNPELTDHFKIFGGHFGDTTIAEERILNPFKDYFL